MLRNLLDATLEKTVVPSFSSIGNHVRERLFNWVALDSYSMKDTVVVLTGGTSGIGRAAASQYVRMGATLVLVARDKQKTAVTIAELERESGHRDIHAVIGDLGSLNDVRQIAAELTERFPVIDVLAHNAGALYNQRRRAENGTDLSVELMVTAPFLLTALLLPQLGHGSSVANRKPARVLSMSSGGMYTEKLDVAHLEMTDDTYQGAQQYARAKRAQVTLSELWAEKIDAQDIVFHALHPGWVDTPGINEALPGFSKVLGPLKLLRSPADGADTLVWLSVDPAAARSSGQFWHDRQPRSPHMSVKTRRADTVSERQALWDWCQRQVGWQFDKS